MCVRSGRGLGLKQKRQYTNRRQKVPRSLRAACYTVGCTKAHQFDTRGRQGKKLYCEHFFSGDLNEGTLGSGEGRGVRAV